MMEAITRRDATFQIAPHPMFSEHLITAQRKLSTLNSQHITEQYNQQKPKKVIIYKPTRSMNASTVNSMNGMNSMKLEREIEDIKKILTQNLSTKVITEHIVSPLSGTNETQQNNEELNLLKTQNSTYQMQIIQLQKQVESLTDLNETMKRELDILRSQNGKTQSNAQSQTINEQVQIGQQNNLSSVQPSAQNVLEQSTQKTIQKSVIIDSGSPKNQVQLQPKNDLQKSLQLTQGVTDQLSIFDEPEKLTVAQLSTLHSAFGSCISKQVRSLFGPNPAKSIYDHFYDISVHVCQLFKNPFEGQQQTFQDIVQCVNELIPQIKTDYTFLSTYKVNERLVQQMEKIFGPDTLSTQLSHDNLKLKNPSALYILICILCCSFKMRPVQYDVLSGDLDLFKEVYGTQVRNAASGQNGKAFVLLPQWIGDDNSVPAYVRVQSK